MGVDPARLVGAAVGTITVPASTGTMVASAPRGIKGLYESGVPVAVASPSPEAQAEANKAINKQIITFRCMRAIVPKSYNILGSQKVLQATTCKTFEQSRLVRLSTLRNHFPEYSFPIL